MPRGKKNKPQTEEAGPGHNSDESGLTAAKILIFAKRISDGRRAIEDLSEDRKTAVAENRGIWKEAKAAGINNDALKRAIEDRGRSPDEVLAEEKSYLYYAGLFRMPVTQIDLFGGLDDPDDNEAESPEVQEAAIHHAGSKGYEAGRQGIDASFCPFSHTDDSEQYQAWMREWHRGQATLAEGMARQ